MRSSRTCARAAQARTPIECLSAVGRHFQALARGVVPLIVGRALDRAGVVRPTRGAAHLLRHSVATSMLRHGASLQDIATLLRHQSIDTTQIYAKVDVLALRQIAQPWPEVSPC